MTVRRTFAHTYKLRAIVKQLPFDVWVDGRPDFDGWCIVGARYGNEKRTREILEALQLGGYRCECRGKPGTAGEFCVWVYVGVQEQSVT